MPSQPGSCNRVTEFPGVTYNGVLRSHREARTFMRHSLIRACLCVPEDTDPGPGATEGSLPGLSMPDGLHSEGSDVPISRTETHIPDASCQFCCSS